MHAQALETIQGKFVQPGHIVSTQLAKIQNFPVIRYNDSSALTGFIDVIIMSVWILPQFGYTSDPFSNCNLDLLSASCQIISK